MPSSSGHGGGGSSVGSGIGHLGVGGKKVTGILRAGVFGPGGAAQVVGEEAETEADDVVDVELDDLKKIRKVQGFFRGWLCRHRWKVIVEEYIKSPHAESMRKRNRSVETLSFSSPFRSHRIHVCVCAI